MNDSSYAYIEAEEKIYYQVDFYYIDETGNTIPISEGQYVEEGADAILPDAPAREGYVFTGWDPEPAAVHEDLEVYAQYAEEAGTIRLTVNYVYSDGTAAAQPWVAEVQSGVTCGYTVPSPEIPGFEADRAVVEFNGAYTENQTVTVTYKGTTASYTVEHYLLDVQGNMPGKPESTETLTGEVGLQTQAEAKTFAGFTAREIVQPIINADGSTVVQVRYERNSYTLTWDTGDGGSYIAPSEVVYGASIDRPSDPTRLGYEFAGWENLPDEMPANDLVVRAKWNEARTASYKVIYWTEKLEEGDYSVGKIEEGSGSVGSVIPTQEQKFEGFKLNSDKSAGDVTITADGMAVKNVYYDRETYTIKFYERQRWNKWVENTSLRITARYGVDVSKQWEKACKDSGWGPNKDDNVQYTLIANMPAGNLEMYQKTSGNVENITYYVEGLNGEWDVYAKFGAPQGVHLTEEDKMPITGFSFSEWKQELDFTLPWEPKDHDLWLRYTRNSYKIYFENCEGISTANVKFDAPISNGQPKNTPKPPANIDSDYTFDGWYLDPGFETRVDWNEKMPAENITIYAKWKAPEYQVTFETNGGNSIDPVTVVKGETLDPLPTPEKEGDTFLGWYTDSSLTKQFIEESKIVKDTVLYARWESSDQFDYEVRYVTKDSNGTEKEIAERDYGKAIRDQVANITAKPIDGYYAKVTALSVLITEQNQVITFEYEPILTWEYTVHYVLEGTDTPVADPVTAMTSNQEVMVSFKAIDGYTLKSDPVQSATRDNPVITFEYAEKTAVYHIQHWFEGLNGEFGLHSITTKTAAEGERVEAKPFALEPVGYTLNLEQDDTVPAGTTDLEKVLTLKLYYTRNSHKVTYRYEGEVPEGAAELLPKAADHKYNSQVTVADDVAINGYTFSGWTTDDTAVAGGKFMMPDGNVEFVGSFTKSVFKYSVEYYYDGELDESETETAEAVLGQVIQEYDDKTKEGYALDRTEGIPLTVGTEEDKNIIRVYYAKDDNGDEVPDKYQAKVTYKAVNGTVDKAGPEYVTIYVDGDPEKGYAEPGTEGAYGILAEEQVPTAEPAESFDPATEAWTVNGDDTSKPTAGTRIYEDSRYVVAYGKDAYTYSVVKHYLDANGNEVDGRTISATALYGQNILEASEVTVLQEEIYEGNAYELIRVEGADKLISSNVDENYVHIYYQQGAFTYSVVKHYLDANGNQVDAVTRSGTALYGQNILEASEVTMLQEEIYEGNTYELVRVEGADKLISSNVDENYVHIYYQQNLYGYEVVKHYENADGAEIATESKTGTATIGTGILDAAEITVNTNETYNGQNYVLVNTVGADNKVTADAEQNKVHIYYSLDEVGTDPIDPNKPDQIPDKYQVVFTYVTENPTYGTVNGTNSVTEVVTRPKNDDGSYDMDAEVYPSANVTADGLGRYYFDYWTDGIRNYADTTEIHATGFTDDTTFTAMFEYRGGNGGGGGGNGGGSGGGGGGHYTGGSEGGPGAATTITPEEVPLAPLPEDVTISDELVPLAPLPKTGQTAKSAITMMFSGILLALTAMSRKRKEEDV